MIWFWLLLLLLWLLLLLFLLVVALCMQDLSCGALKLLEKHNSHGHNKL